MLSNWYKKQKARKEAPKLLRWIAGMPILGIAAVITARWALQHVDGLLSADQANFMVATLVMIAVPSFVFCGYCAVKLGRLSRDAKLPLTALLRPGED
ncbi:MAG TPA: hypothetical protein VGN11_00200 [Candidatus Baltobacteraceae bacterium]|jgi:hypothetical protein|nr:hypothetical protein [Candidatus Baltobacteraceae bacterium]